ncbi:hypothetical protein D3C80_1136080 [compost metagenome]
MQLGGTHIRAPHQQIGRYVLEHGGVEQGHQADVAVQLGQVARWPADQGGQGIARARHLALEIGNGAQGGQVLGLGLLQVKFGIGAAVEQALGDLVAALLQFGVVAGNVQTGFGGAQGVVGLRQLCVQQHQHVFVVGLGGEPGRIGRFDGAGKTPPEIQFPTDIETGAVLPEMQVLGVVATGLVAVQVQGVGVGLLQLRVAATQGDA